MEDSMGEPTEAEKAILSEWMRERDDLDNLISGLQKRIAARSGAAGAVPASTGKIAPDEFFRLSTPEAIKKYLKIVGKPARSTTDIIDGLKAGGMDTNYTNVYTALMRLQKRDAVIAKVGENWGLDEWYPAAPLSVKVKAAVAAAQGAEPLPEEETGMASEDEAVESKNQRPHPAGKGRKTAIAEFIKTHGPSTRSELLAGTDVPDGTIGYCLRDETKFTKGEDGKYRNVE
jgi:hypothetical protein